MLLAKRKEGKNVLNGKTPLSLDQESLRDVIEWMQTEVKLI